VWLPLLRRVTETSSTWTIWKNAESALNGWGDIDSAADPRDWDAIIHEFLVWATAHRLGPVVICRHAPDLVAAAALHDGEPFFELDLLPSKVFLGSTMFRYQDLLPLAEIDGRGFRRIRPGAEGLIKLLCNGTHRNGLPDQRGLDAFGVVPLLVRDPDGAGAMASLFGPGERAALRLVAAVVEGGWDRQALLRLQGWFLLRALREPRSVTDKIRFRAALRRCPVLRAMISGRRIPQPADDWLRTVRTNHDVYDNI
jgi:hypothetical protein